MTSAPGTNLVNGEEHRGNLPADILRHPVYAYNLDDTKTPRGIKVRWKIRVVSGPDAARYDTRLNDAILELLRWTHRHARQLHAARP